MNICADVAKCGKGAAGCELENGNPVNLVGVEKTLQYSTDGILQLTYSGIVHTESGSNNTKSFFS